MAFPRGADRGPAAALPSAPAPAVASLTSPTFLTGPGPFHHPIATTLTNISNPHTPTHPPQWPTTARCRSCARCSRRPPCRTRACSSRYTHPYCNPTKPNPPLPHPTHIFPETQRALLRALRRQARHLALQRRRGLLQELHGEVHERLEHRQQAVRRQDTEGERRRWVEPVKLKGSDGGAAGGGRARLKRQLEETEGATAAVRYDMRMECTRLHMGGRSCLRRP